MALSDLDFLPSGPGWAAPDAFQWCYARCPIHLDAVNPPMPLPDLHRHLDGSLRPLTLKELALRAGRAVPADALPARGESRSRPHGPRRRGTATRRDPHRDRAARRAAHRPRYALLDDPRVLDLVLESEVTIEACPTSNLHTGAIPALAAHPLPRWLRLGVRACVNTDNTLLSSVDAPEEHRRARAIPGMDDALLQRAIDHGHAARFSR